MQFKQPRLRIWFARCLASSTLTEESSMITWSEWVGARRSCFRISIHHLALFLVIPVSRQTPSHSFLFTQRCTVRCNHFSSMSHETVSGVLRLPFAFFLLFFRPLLKSLKSPSPLPLLPPAPEASSSWLRSEREARALWKFSSLNAPRSSTTKCRPSQPAGKT